MKVKVKVINCLISKRKKKGFFTNLSTFNINVKVNVKVTKGTFSKRRKKTVI